MTNETDHQKEDACRLCGGVLEKRFIKRIFGKYDVAYFKCIRCQSLQTESPYWLDEAYNGKNLSNIDTGAAQRNINNLAACYIIAKLLRAHNVIDIGGGDGLLCRLLRDYRINCYVKDKYATPTYAQGFTEENFDTPDLVVGFEVLEHYPNPVADLNDLFGYQSRALLLSTAIFTDEGQDWWYLSPESGQHVFFYSQESLEMIAAKYGYRVILSGGFILFLKDASILSRVICRFFLKRTMIRLLKSVILLLPARGAWQDRILQVEVSRSTQQKQY